MTAFLIYVSLLCRYLRLNKTLWFSVCVVIFSQNTLGNSTESADSIAPSSVSLSLYQADISDLVGWASAITDKSIVLHPSVSGQVTVIAGEPMPREDAYQLFLTVLELHGFTVVEGSNALTVIPAQLGREQSI